MFGICIPTVYSGGWNIQRSQNSNCSPLFGFPMLFHFEQNGAIFSQSIGNHKEWSPFCLGFQWFGFGMVETIAIALAMVLTIPKPNNWKSKLQNLQYSNVFRVPMFSIQAPLYNLMSFLLIADTVTVICFSKNFRHGYSNLFFVNFQTLRTPRIRTISDGTTLTTRLSRLSRKMESW